MGIKKLEELVNGAARIHQREWAAVELLAMFRAFAEPDDPPADGPVEGAAVAELEYARHLIDFMRQEIIYFREGLDIANSTDRCIEYADAFIGEYDGNVPDDPGMPTE